MFLLLGAGIGAFIYEFVPTDLLANFAGAGSLWAVPLAAIVQVMYLISYYKEEMIMAEKKRVFSGLFGKKSDGCCNMQITEESCCDVKEKPKKKRNCCDMEIVEEAEQDGGCCEKQ